jgi:hypothetical protein
VRKTTLAWPAGLEILCVELIVAQVWCEVSSSWRASSLRRLRTTPYHALLLLEVLSRWPFRRSAVVRYGG